MRNGLLKEFHSYFHNMKIFEILWLLNKSHSAVKSVEHSLQIIFVLPPHTAWPALWIILGRKQMSAVSWKAQFRDSSSFAFLRGYSLQTNWNHPKPSALKSPWPIPRMHSHLASSSGRELCRGGHGHMDTELPCSAAGAHSDQVTAKLIPSFLSCLTDTWKLKYSYNKIKQGITTAALSLSAGNCLLLQTVHKVKLSPATVHWFHRQNICVH